MSTVKDEQPATDEEIERVHLVIIGAFAGVVAVVAVVSTASLEPHEIWKRVALVVADLTVFSVYLRLRQLVLPSSQVHRLVFTLACVALTTMLIALT